MLNNNDSNPVEAERLRGVVYISLGRHDQLEKCEQENVALKRRLEAEKPDGTVECFHSRQLSEMKLQRDNAAVLLREALRKLEIAKDVIDHARNVIRSAATGLTLFGEPDLADAFTADLKKLEDLAEPLEDKV